MNKIGKKTKYYVEFRKSVCKRQAKIVICACIVLFLISAVYLVRGILLHAVPFVQEEHLLIIYAPIGIYSLLAMIILLSLISKWKKYWRILEMISYFTMCILPYWGLVIMIVSVIEGRTTNFLIWVVGMLSSCAGICIHPHVSVSNQILVTVISYAACAYFKVDLGESHILNFFVYGVICVWAALLRYYNEYSEFEKTQELNAAVKQAEQSKADADRANAAKSAFLSLMSHEIRTPINVILGMDELILRETDNARVTEHANSIKDAGDMLLTLVNDILDGSKIEAGKMEIIPYSYHLKTTVHNLVNLLGNRAKVKDLQFEIHVNEKTPNALFGDEVRLIQVLTNLLTNAIKYTREGSVTLSVNYKMISGDVAELEFAIKDTGIGIKEENIDKLCNSFQRVDEIQNRNIEGTGLGLSIVSQILKLMNGRMEIESKYGEGSCFTVYIPQKIESMEGVGILTNLTENEERDNTKHQCMFHAPEARILIVDDNATNRIVAKALLQENQVQVDEADSGSQMLSMVKENEYDLILLDYRMPDMDGVEALQKMREEKLCQDTPVIALTANTVSDARSFYMERGFTDFMSKPIDPVKYELLIYKHLPKSKIKDAIENSDTQNVDNQERTKTYQNR